MTRRSREVAEKALGTGQTPLEIILNFMNEAAKNGDSERAVRYATLAAPYIHPRLNAVDLKREPEPEVFSNELDFSKLTTEELRIFVAISEKASVSR